MKNNGIAQAIGKAIGIVVVTAVALVAVSGAAWIAVAIWVGIAGMIR